MSYTIVDISSWHNDSMNIIYLVYILLTFYYLEVDIVCKSISIKPGNMSLLVDNRLIKYLCTTTGKRDKPEVL